MLMTVTLKTDLYGATEYITNTQVYTHSGTESGLLIINILPRNERGNYSAATCVCKKRVVLGGRAGGVWVGGIRGLHHHPV